MSDQLIFTREQFAEALGDQTALDPVSRAELDSIAERIWARIEPAFEAVARDGVYRVGKPLPPVESAHRVEQRAQDSDPARHGLTIRDLKAVRGEAAVRTLNRSGGASLGALERIESSFTYHAPKGDQPERYEWLRREAKALALLVMDFCMESRERSLAITKLEEFAMWANKAIAVNE